MTYVAKKPDMPEGFEIEIERQFEVLAEGPKPFSVMRPLETEDEALLADIKFLLELNETFEDARTMLREVMSEISAKALSR